MTEILKINMDTALHDPEAAFGTPSRLAQSVGLTRGQKIATLQRWSQQVADRLRAGAEGMATQRTSAADVALLDAITAAISELRSVGADAAGK